MLGLPSVIEGISEVTMGIIERIDRAVFYSVYMVIALF